MLLLPEWPAAVLRARQRIQQPRHERIRRMARIQVYKMPDTVSLKEACILEPGLRRCPADGQGRDEDWATRHYCRRRADWAARDAGCSYDGRVCLTLVEPIAERRALALQIRRRSCDRSHDGRHQESSDGADGGQGYGTTCSSSTVPVPRKPFMICRLSRHSAVSSFTPPCIRTTLRCR